MGSKGGVEWRQLCGRSVPLHGGKPSSAPKAGADHGSQAGLGSRLHWLSLGLSFTQAMLTPAPAQSKGWGQAWPKVSAPSPAPAGPSAASPSMPVPHLWPPGQQRLPLPGLAVGIRLLPLWHLGRALRNTGQGHPGELLPPEELLPGQRAAASSERCSPGSANVRGLALQEPLCHRRDPCHNGLWAR